MRIKKGLLVLSLVLALSTLLGYMPSYAQIPFIDGGVIGDKALDGSFEYEEMFFMTGEPILLKGVIKIPAIPKDKDSFTQKITFNLSNTEKNINLTRNITYSVVKTQKDKLSQTLYEKTLSKYDESIVTNQGTYTLGKYTFNDSRIYDHSPSVSYFSGNLTGERTYYLDGNYLANSGILTITDKGAPIVGYEHQWGSSETFVNRQVISHRVKNPAYNPTVYNSIEWIEWNAVLDINMASTQSVSFMYQGTDPQSISFRGSYFRVTDEENVLSIKYDLPVVTNAGAVDHTATRRVNGTINKSKSVVLETKPLITPKIRDIGDHWASKDIFLLTSLEIFDVQKEYFAPDAYISRLEFAKAVVNSLEGPLPEPTRTEVMRRRRPGVTTPYIDVLPEDPYYHYFEYIKQNNIMSGENNYFKPNEPITRAEMVAVLIKTLGLEYLAPNPPYRTSFSDDDKIGEWAKDFVYMANEIGLISGYDDGSFKPLNRVTKAEAASMIHGLIKHLKDEITYDYREKIIKR